MSLSSQEEQKLRALIGRVEDLEAKVDATDAYGVALEKIALQDIFVRNTGDTIIGALDIIHTSTEADDHVLEIDADAAGFGDVKAIDIDYITGAIAAGQDEGVILINIDETAATGGDVFALEVLATDGSAGIYGLKTGALIGPIHQDSGTFANPTTGTDNTPDTDVPAMIDGSTGTTTTIFEADNEYIIIGAAAAFEEIEFILTTVSNVSIKPTFWYSTAGTGQFTQFTPVDGTNGFRNTGVIAWDASDLTSHVADTGTGTYDIKIIRTKNNLTTSPVLGYAKVATTTEYIWDKDGKLTIGNALINQAADGVGLTVAGYDDMSAETLRLYQASNQISNIIATDRLVITSGNGDYIRLESAVDMYLDVGATNDSVYFRDENDLYFARLHSKGSLYLIERASAGPDVAGYGQLWIKNDNPCELWFTDDAGTDTQIV
ncbi:hypothetical protein KAR91_54290 [Candidatus Pacearchaeota archaeon]|nr:hypothetical protein [Candidatus Pacearchaeota archaeon]